MKVGYIVLAAGPGSRVGTPTPKPFLTIDHRTVLEKTLEAFPREYTVVVVPPGLDYTVKNWDCITGGETRVLSLWAGLQHLDGCDVIVVHDGARPFITRESLDTLVEMAHEHGAAGYAQEVVNTPIRVSPDGFLHTKIDRDSLYESVTPQAFRAPYIYAGVERAIETGHINETEFLSLVSCPVKISGEYDDLFFKITTKRDLYSARRIAKEGKVAIVTGGGRGIGRAIAMELADAGIRVVVNARTSSEIAAVARKIDGAPFTGDISNPNVVTDLFEYAERVYGRVDILVNNAGVGLHQGIVDTGLLRWKEVLDVNLTGSFLCIREALLRMSHGGVIVNVVSSCLDGGRKGLSAYGSAKAGLLHLTEVAALEGSERGVSVFAVAPRRTATAMRDQMFDGEDDGGLDTPEKAAKIVAMCCLENIQPLSGQVLWIH